MSGGYLMESRVYLREGDALYSASPIHGPKDAVDLLGKNLLCTMDREAFLAVSMDTKKRPISYHIVSVGDLTSAPVSIPNVFKAAILANAESILVMHNHPSGDATPSQADIDVTHRLREAGTLMGIEVVDHVVVGTGGRYYSFADHGWPGIGDSYDRDMVTETKSKYVPGKEKLDELTRKLEDGVKNVFESERYKEYLRVMSRFYRYSPGNCMLIALQKPDATAVAGYQAWRKNFGRQVRSGEKGIQILQPAPYKQLVEVEKTDQFGRPVIGSDGKPVKEAHEVTRQSFRVGYVFDVSQTDGKELPDIVHVLGSKVENHDQLMDALMEASPVPVSYGETGRANGFYDRGAGKIVLRQGLPESQEVKTLVHEIAHSMLHSGRESDIHDRMTKEVQAESVAYVVCENLGIDSSDYSFGYIAGWSKSMELKELKASLDAIQKTALQILGKVERNLTLSEGEALAMDEKKTILAGNRMSM